MTSTEIASFSREGRAVVLEMESLADIKFLNNQLVQYGIRNARRVEEYLTRLDGVMQTTEDERIIVAGAAVAVNALKACIAAIKAEVVKNVEHNHLHLHGGADPQTMTSDERRAYIADLRRRIANA